MVHYKNLNGDAGVVAYAIGRDFIRVQFKNGPSYRYSDASAGKSAIDHMKMLARTGRGLSTFISQQQPPHDDETP